MYHVHYMAADQRVWLKNECMSFGIFTCCLSRAYTAMEKSNNTRLYAVHVQPLVHTSLTWKQRSIHSFGLPLMPAILMQKFPGSVKLTCPEKQCHIMRRLENWKHKDLAATGYKYNLYHYIWPAKGIYIIYTSYNLIVLKLMRYMGM